MRRVILVVDRPASWLIIISPSSRELPIIDFLFSVFISLPRFLNFNCAAILHQPLCMETYKFIVGGSWLVGCCRIVELFVVTCWLGVDVVVLSLSGANCCPDSWASRLGLGCWQGVDSCLTIDGLWRIDFASWTPWEDRGLTSVWVLLGRWLGVDSCLTLGLDFSGLTGG